MEDEKHVIAGQTGDDSTMQLLASIGFSLLISVMGVALFGCVFPGENNDALHVLAWQGAFLGGFAVVHGASYAWFSERMAKSAGSRFYTIAVVALFVPGFVILLVQSFAPGVPWIAVSFAALCSGCTIGLLMLSWGTTWSVIGHGRGAAVVVARDTAASTLLAMLPALLVLFAPPWVIAVAMAAAFCGSLALNVVCLRMSRARQSSNAESVQPSPVKARLLTRASFTPAVMGFVYGLSFCYLVLLFGFPLSLVISCAGAACAGLFALVKTVKEKAVPRVPEIEHVVFLVSALCLLALQTAQGALAIAAGIALTSTMFGYFIFNPRTVAVVAYRQTALSLHHCARENAVSIVASLIAWVALAALVGTGVPLDQAAAGMTVVALAGILAEPLFTPYISYTAIEHLVDDASATDVAQGSAPSSEASEDRAGWKMRCVEICREYEISPRETEVFMLLARGRNAEYISGELFISTHTVRTHIYRIYQKLGINDRQELLDIVEQGARREQPPSPTTQPDE